uniref:Ig-like domain-containing protein n=1 Tax=Lates calcarifer TaxID=8187 RepID=A0A4W6EFJ0_LATCA
MLLFKQLEEPVSHRKDSTDAEEEEETQFTTQSTVTQLALTSLVSLTTNTQLSNRAVVILQPNWSEIYRGETITVRCEIQGGGDTEWEYKWKTTTSFKPSNQHEHRISPASSSHSGDYRCKGRVKSSQHRTTEWSSSVRLTVHTQQDMCVSLEEEIQCFTLTIVNQSLSGLEVSLFFFLSKRHVKSLPEFIQLTNIS